MRDRELPVTVIGGGGFGRALAHACASVGRRVFLVSRAVAHDAPGDLIERVDDVGAAVSASKLVLIAVGSDRMIEVARELAQVCDGRHVLVHGLRGLVSAEGDAPTVSATGSLVTATTILRRETPSPRVGVLAGPLVASGVLKGRPSGCIVGSRYPECVSEVRAALTGPLLRVYGTTDCVGVEVAAALCGTLAMAAGFAMAAGIGPSATAVMVTRGMHEAARVGKLFGADPETFCGLAGFGDLTAAMADEERPEVQLGRLVATGGSVDSAIAKVGRVGTELTLLAPRIASLAAKNKIDVPVLTVIAGVLSGGLTPADALRALMEREHSA